MVVATDTSFLFSVYGNDIHTPVGLAWIRQNPQEILTSAFNRFELLNALRLAEFRNVLGVGVSGLYASQFDQDLQQGRLVETSFDLSDILAEAHRLSSVHTLTGGHRAFDILHIAAARLMKATHFLTFDDNQKRLAESEGLSVPV